jgi:DNA-binding transcriptional MerR regulator
VLSIGEFSRLSHLSIRTLRRYHDAGLLEPAHVDEISGYRYYTPEQIPPAQVIHRLRELDVPLADVHRILRTPDPQVRAGLVAEHLQRLEDQLERTRSAVTSLRRLLRPEPADLHVELRQVPEMLVAAVEATLGHGELLDWYPVAMARLDAVVPEPAGPPGGSYDNELFTDGRGRALVYLPVASAPPAGRGVQTVLLPAVEVAVTTHPGEHDTIDVTYGQLGSWVVEHALAVAGPVRESYPVGPRDTSDPARWRTEIGWPVFRVAAG